MRGAEGHLANLAPLAFLPLLMTLSTWLSYITRFAPSLDTRTFHTLTEKLMFGKEPNASRKYVDLILNASSKYANWDPGVPVEVGDYGSINKDTGLFDYEGNIFSEAFRNLLNFSGDPAHQTEPENKYVIQSNIETGAAVELGPTALDDTPPPWATLDEDGTEDAPYDGPQDSDTEEDD
ncbi:hypothetical protein FRB99_003724 [Tulasnella sp. 403]|nr:hypothetical protein FRB99_003724 [Tulasnella sp. 403]